MSPHARSSKRHLLLGATPLPRIDLDMHRWMQYGPYLCLLEMKWSGETGLGNKHGAAFVELCAKKLAFNPPCNRAAAFRSGLKTRYPNTVRLYYMYTVLCWWNNYSGDFLAARFHQLDRAKHTFPSKFQSEMAKWPFWQRKDPHENLDFNPLSGLLSHLAERTSGCDVLLKEVHVAFFFSTRTFSLWLPSRKQKELINQSWHLACIRPAFS